MTKRQLIDHIIDTNPSAEPGFLSQFEQGDLLDYLRKLNCMTAPRLSGGTGHWRQPNAQPAVNAEVMVMASPCPAPHQGREYETLHLSRSLVDMVDPFQEPVPEPDQTVEADQVEIGVYEPVAARDYPDDLDLNANVDVPVPEVEPAQEMVLVGGPNDEQESWLF